MKISIISAYTWYNKGDAAILLGTINELNDFFSDEEITFNILSFTPDIDESNYKKLVPNIEFVGSNLFNPYPLKKTTLRKFFKICKMGTKYVLLKITSLISPKILKRLSTTIQTIGKSDLIIICGGGFLGGGKYNSLMHLLQMDIVSTLGITTCIWGTSIEPPKSSLLTKVTELVLKKIDYIMPREQVTEKYLKEIVEENKIITTPDMAFRLENRTSTKIEELVASIRQNTYKNLIGITMREWMFPKSENPQLAKEKYETALVDLINQSESQFIFIPQVIFFGDDDRVFADKIKYKLDNPSNLIVLKQDFSPYELKYLIGNLDQFLGTRMHSNIFSASIIQPPVAIAYEKKTNGIMHELDLDDYVVDIEDVDADILVNLLNKSTRQNTILKEKLEFKMNEIQDNIRKATETLFTSIKGMNKHG